MGIEFYELNWVGIEFYELNWVGIEFYEPNIYMNIYLYKNLCNGIFAILYKIKNFTQKISNYLKSAIQNGNARFKMVPLKPIKWKILSFFLF